MATLEEQLQALQAQVRQDAASARLRVHLFQLLCVMGQWQRALAQLQLCAQLDAKALPMAQTYREAIRCEKLRTEVFAGRGRPAILGEPPPWIGPLLEALRLDGAGHADAAAALRAQALEQSDAPPCRLDDQDCEGLLDADSRLGPVLEVVANAQYFWLPMQACQAIEMQAPADLRDLVWAPVDIVLVHGGRLPALMPSRYPESEHLATHPQADQLRQCKLTDWTPLGPEMWAGLGQRMWVSDLGEHPMLDTRNITWAAEGAAPVSAPSTG